MHRKRGTCADFFTTSRKSGIFDVLYLNKLIDHKYVGCAATRAHWRENIIYFFRRKNIILKIYENKIFDWKILKFFDKIWESTKVLKNKSKFGQIMNTEKNQNLFKIIFLQFSTFLVYFQFLIIIEIFWTFGFFVCKQTNTIIAKLNKLEKFVSINHGVLRGKNSFLEVWLMSY